MTFTIRYVWTDMYFKMVDYVSEFLDWRMDGGGNQFIRGGEKGRSATFIIHTKL